MLPAKQPLKPPVPDNTYPTLLMRTQESPEEGTTETPHSFSAALSSLVKRHVSSLSLDKCQEILTTSEHQIMDNFRVEEYINQIY